MFADYPKLENLSYAYGGVGKSVATFKASPQDFVVEEELGFELSGEGEHQWLLIKAMDMNTEFTLKQLARAFNVEKRAISYSGKKDRRAITTQWFSVHVPGVELTLPTEIHPNIEVLNSVRHNKKLRRGAHRFNHFDICLRDPHHLDRDAFTAIVQLIAEKGFPNYFGPQRFGHGENNISAACHAMESQRRLKRQDRDRVFSTLRSWDFNRCLHQRVIDDSWRTFNPGDLLQLSGSSSFFQPDVWDADMQQRLESGDISIAGVLPGKGKIETGYQTDETILEYLIKQKLEQSVRSFSVRPGNFKCDFLSDQIQLSFDLPKGAYATSLLRELIGLQESHS
ncbi:MAG: tRNA pseudouridine(13) synthase TruD [Pseudomonadales bacterium]|nr:tRNA pseudouridine(13) synthase TruD [Pseudomonadales bacterium]